MDGEIQLSAINNIDEDVPVPPAPPVPPVADADGYEPLDDSDYADQNTALEDDEDDE